MDSQTFNFDREQFRKEEFNPKSKRWQFKHIMLVDQSNYRKLGQWLLPTPEICGSNPVIVKFYLLPIVLKRRKERKKWPGKAHLKIYLEHFLKGVKQSTLVNYGQKIVYLVPTRILSALQLYLLPKVEIYECRVLTTRKFIRLSETHYTIPTRLFVVCHHCNDRIHLVEYISDFRALQQLAHRQLRTCL